MSAAPGVLFERMIGLLADPATHGFAPGTPRAERIDTHTASVLLVGDRAFKLRRAVDYGFLDYSSRPLRRASALREIEENERSAPGLYLGLGGIAQGPMGALVFHPPPAPPDCEPVVVMRRFDDAALFDRMAEAGELHRELMHQTGLAIAELHRGAPPRPCLTPLPAMALDEVGALDGLAPVIGADVVAKTAPKLREIGQALAETAATRQARRCHGDLHLRNIVLWRGRPTPFDCIDFNDALTDIDPLYDLAFLLMDLDHRGFGALGVTCLNAWAERMTAAPDALIDTAYGGLRLLPLFKACRAAIRAKVAGLTAQTCHDPSAVAEARGYLELVARYLTDPEPARLIAVGGMSGSGKSTLARSLAAALGSDGARTVIVLRSDALRKGLWGVEETDRLPPEAYSRDISVRVYAELLSRAHLALTGGAAVILDAAHLRADERMAAMALARDTQVRLDAFWLDAPVETLRARVDARRSDVSDADSRIVTVQAGIETGAIDWNRLDAGTGAERVATEALDVISSTSELP